jgi:hypothetical protein
MSFPPTANESKVTVEMLDLMVRGSNQLLRSLKIVLHDLSLIREGKRLVFPVDFYEIHTFLWPEKRQSQSRQVTLALLKSKDIEFTLLPGTVVELIGHLKRLISSNRTARSVFDEMLNRPFVYALLKYFNIVSDQDKDAKVLRAMSQVNDGLRQLAHLGLLVGRLEHLYSMKNLKPLNDFLAGDDFAITPNAQILRECEMSLTFRRATSRNNFIDAHNYALAWALSDAHFDRKDTIYYLVTSSPNTFHVYGNLRWFEFPKHLKHPDHPEASLVRHPIQVLYLAQILKLGDLGWKELQETIENLTQLLVAWRQIPAYDGFLQDRRQKLTRVVKFPTNRRYLNHFANFRRSFDSLFAPVRVAIESDIISEENFRRARGVDSHAVGVRAGSLSDPSQFTSTRLVYSVFDTVTQLTIKTMERVTGSIPPDLIAEIDTRSVVAKAKRLELRHEYNPTFSCIEVVVRDRVTGDVIFSGDIYEDYYALWWTTGSDFAGFLQEVHKFLATARSARKKSGAGLSWDKEKEYDGVYLFCLGVPEPKRVPLDDVPDLDPDSLLEAANGERVFMTRIATDIGDICYDFEAFRGIPQRAGIISHLKFIVPLSWLIENTNQKPAPTLEVRRAVSNCLNLAKEVRGI